MKKTAAAAEKASQKAENRARKEASVGKPWDKMSRAEKQTGVGGPRIVRSLPRPPTKRQEEIARQLRLEAARNPGVPYLNDEGEWVRYVPKETRARREFVKGTFRYTERLFKDYIEDVAERGELKIEQEHVVLPSEDDTSDYRYESMSEISEDAGYETVSSLGERGPER